MIRTILFIGLFFLSIACVQKIDDLTIVPISAEVPLPIGRFTLKADKLTKIGDSLNVEENSEGIIQLYYDSEVLRATLFDRLTIPDQTFNESVPFSSFAFMGGTDSKVKVSRYNSFTINNVDLLSPPPKLDSVIFKGGSLKVSQFKNFDHNLVSTIKFLTFYKDGSPISVVLNNNGSTTVPLAGAKLGLKGVSGTTTNTIDYEITSVVSDTGSDTQGTVSVSVSMESMEFSFMKGDFSTYAFDHVSSTYETNLPESEFPDNVAFTNPIVNVAVLNSSGIPFGLDISELSVKKSDGSIEQVTGSFDDDTYDVAEAQDPGETAESDFTIDKNNTDNFIDLLNEIPQEVNFNGDLTANPSGTPVTGNFVTDSSEIVVNTRFILPLEGYANEYVLTDTVDAKLVIEDETIIPESINFRLQGENAFPMLIALQLYFLDSLDNSVVLDSLFLTNEEQQLFPAGEVDNEGLVVAPTFMTSDVLIDNEKYERIKGTGSIKIAAYVSTTGADSNPPESIKISIDDYFTVGIGVMIKAKIDLNNLSRTSK
ncbi:MAG: hypothetical protein KDC79_00095 [Cyclobacteriaceae bacterium]|nr:hypothetical protein [Cyclobacteriaceae bacterium]